MTRVGRADRAPNWGRKDQGVGEATIEVRITRSATEAEAVLWMGMIKRKMIGGGK